MKNRATMRPQNPLLFLLLLVSTSTEHVVEAQCQVFNTEGVDVSVDYVVEKDALADCQGDNQCKDFRITNCDQVICWGLEACTRAQITNVTTLVSCEGQHSCHRTEVLGLKSSNNKNMPPNVECIGNQACDVAILENVGEVECLGFQACRKAHMKAGAIKCTGGESGRAACDQVYLHTHCVYCGVNGCGSHNCNVKLLVGGDDVMAEDPEEDDPTTYEYCDLESMMGECPKEWAAQLEYEKEVEYGTDENEDGARR
mmetsp:Transcript_99545/g.149058  ORF Transcript_99545/g.149058 Transcript_99545/m.149058 type:complete len:256 (+) Transcript_99545:108-875(+)